MSETTVTLQTYTLELVGPLRDFSKPFGFVPALGIPPVLLTETEENLTDLLPEGYSVSIKEWDAEEETPNV